MLRRRRYLLETTIDVDDIDDLVLLANTSTQISAARDVGLYMNSDKTKIHDTISSLMKSLCNL